MCVYIYIYIQTYITLHYITLHYITLHYITLHYVTLHHITLHYTILYYIALYITLHYITLHYNTLHYTTLHYITLHYITLHYITRSAVAGRTVWRCSVPPARPRASRHPTGSASSAMQPSQLILSRRLSGQAGADQDELSLKLSAPGLRPFPVQACVVSRKTGRVQAK